MSLAELKENLDIRSGKKEALFNFQMPELGKIQIYHRSIQHCEDNVYFMAKAGSEKNLYILCSRMNKAQKFEGSFTGDQSNGLSLKKCPLNTANRKALQELFKFTRPVLIGLKNSFGFGDRIGEANAGHLRALGKSDIFPVLAQQSIRELTRTGRSADEVMDAAVWAVFQEGYTRGFGADADHLKTTYDIDMLVKAGFVMFTFDPGEFVNNEADNLGQNELIQVLLGYPWDELNDSLTNVKLRYLKKSVNINKKLKIKPSEIDLLRAYAKYGRSLAHVKKLHDHLKYKYQNYESQVEISVDETEAVTSIFEHYFISKELHRLGVKYTSLAPRFVGDFEKGIDYKGDLKLFEKEYKKHAAVADYFGDYKISLHSGSDKFSIYKVVAKLKKAAIHIKTAGTSYLEVLKVVALNEPALFRSILDFSKMHYDTEKKSYLVSADIKNVKNSSEYSDEDLFSLFNSNDVRQILHVTYGKVLSERTDNGAFMFKEKIIDCLKRNEEVHYELLIKHFKKHLRPFKL